MGCFTALSRHKCVMAYISLFPPALLVAVLIPNAMKTYYRIYLTKKSDKMRENTLTSTDRNQINTLWGHTFRWLIFLLLLAIQVLQILESCMSAVRHYIITSNFIYIFIINDILSMCAVICCLIVYTYIIELHKQLRFLWVIWIYLMLSVVCSVGKTIMLSPKHMKNEGLNSAAFHLMVVSLVSYVIMFLIDSYTLATKKSIPYAASSSKMNSDIRFLYPFETLPSKLSFHWLNRLLQYGYKSPLESENLGKLPMEECSKENFIHFQKAFEAEKLRAKRKSVQPSLWRCYFNVFWVGLLVPMVCQLICSHTIYVSPLLLDKIVDYVVIVTQSKEISNSNSSIWFFGCTETYNISSPEYFINSGDFFSNGYVLAIIMFMVALFQGFGNQNILFLSSRQGARLKGAIQAMVFDKTLHLPSQFTSDSDISQGQILNHMSVDPMHLFMLFHFSTQYIGIPIQVCVGCVLLYIQLGLSTIFAVIVILVSCPIQYLIGKRMAVLEKKALEKTDERIKKSNETLQSIKLLKLYAWEDSFCKSILRSRYKEIILLLKVGLFRMVALLVTDGCPVVAGAVCFSLYPYIEGKALSPGKVFSSYAIILILNVCLFLTPMVINIFAHAYVSTNRLQKFFTIKDIEPSHRCKHRCDDTPTTENSSKNVEDHANKPKTQWESIPLKTKLTDSDIVAPSLDNNVIVQIKNGGFSWGDNEEVNACILHDINLKVEKGCLTIVVGPVGSGKSSLLYALLGEMTTHTGSVTWDSDVSLAYGAQKAWLLNTTLRENILFGKPFDATLYSTVIQACALQPDIDMLIAGDLTEIGEKGINLSGGQKQRISLARTMYSNANFIVLDDPFSALDVHVGGHIFENGIQKLLLLQKRTILLVTHQLQFLPHAHKILGMEKGKITVDGTYDELKESHPEIFRIIAEEEDMLNESADQTSPEREINSMKFNGYQDILPCRTLSIEDVKQKTLSLSPTQFSSALNYKSHDNLHLTSSYASGYSSQDIKTRVAEDIQFPFEPVRSAISYTSLTYINVDDDTGLRKRHLRMQLSKESGGLPKEQIEEAGKLIDDEERETGSVSWRVYCRYAQAATWTLVIATILGYFTKALVLRMVSDIWLAKWSDASVAAELQLKDTNSNMSLSEAYDLKYYITGYIALSVASIFVLALQVFALELMALNASRNLHKGMVKAIVKAPLRFFDTTPVGRVLNRMSGDTIILDEKMSVTTDGVLFCFMFIIGGILMNAIFTPLFIIPAVLMFIFFVLVQRFYIVSSRELQRLDSISKSPILAHFSETLGGLSTLRAYGHEKDFQCKNWERVDTNNTALLFLHTAHAWMGIRLDTIGAITIFSSSICTVTSGILGYIDIGIVSVGIAYAITSASFLTWCMRCVSEFEIYLNAAERICYYNDVKPEVDTITGNTPDMWPAKGEIQLDKVSLRYAANLTKVVKNINLQIKAGQKTGICGRTGSGKSSLTLSIFNMIDICEGQILIDGIDIKKIPLHDLRSRLAIIPQDPVLFSGTVRYNLDPESRHSEPEIWRSLEIAQLMPLICSLQGRLDAIVMEGGSNFSVGQRQLFCLARAFLRNAQILVMDEPTASVDMATDAIIQEVTQSVFKEKTIVTIAHRVSTILNYDYIIVMDAGKVTEEGTPTDLINKSGVFAEMLKKNQ